MLRRVLANAGAAAVVVALALGSASLTPASADHLRMTITNNSNSITLYFASKSEVKQYPETIPPGTTSSEIESNEQHGQITYMNNSNSADATCTVTLGFNYTDAGDCQDKKFTLTNTGNDNGAACLLSKDGTCGGTGNCYCNFTFAAGGQ